MSLDGQIILSDDESADAELLVAEIEHSIAARRQLAAELVILRKLLASARRERIRLPIQTRRAVERYPLYSRRVAFVLQPTHRLELTPCANGSTPRGSTR